MEEPITNQTTHTGSALPAEAAPAQEPDASPAAPAAVKKKPPLKTVMIIAAVCAAVLAVAVIFLVRSGPSSIAKRYALASWNDQKTAASLCIYDWEAYLLTNYDDDAEKFFEKQSDYYDADISSWSQYYKAVDANLKESLEDEYGKYKITAEVTKSKDMSVKKLLEENASHIKELESHIAFDADTIADVKLVTIKLKLAGEDDIDRTKMAVYMVKAGGRWGVLDWDYVD